MGLSKFPDKLYHSNPMIQYCYIVSKSIDFDQVIHLARDVFYTLHMAYLLIGFVGAKGAINN